MERDKEILKRERGTDLVVDYSSQQRTQDPSEEADDITSSLQMTSERERERQRETQREGGGRQRQRESE